MVPMAGDIDQLRLDYGSGVELGLKIVLALVLFGIALDTPLSQVRAVARRPLVFAVGMAAQFALVPAVAVLATRILDVRGSVAVGLILVVSCPAGNVSNILTHRARGDVALSISMTGVSTLAAALITPVSLTFWSSLSPRADAALRDIELDRWDLVIEAVFVIGLPFALGVLLGWRWPAARRVANRVVEPAVLTILLVLVLGGLGSQLGTFIDYVGSVVGAVIALNLIVLAIGYGTGRGLRLPTAGVRAMTFELSMRNTGLALVLAVGFFPDLGGVAFVAATWGLWDVTVGLALATWWRRRTPPADADSLRAGPSNGAGRPG